MHLIPFLRITGIAVFLIFIVGCSASQQVTNPIFPTNLMKSEANVLSQKAYPFHVGVRLAQYLDQDNPVYFLVANDGGHSLVRTCQDTPCIYDGVEELEKAYLDCADLRLGTECTLLYVRKLALAQNSKFNKNITYKILSGTNLVPAKKAKGKIIYLPGFSGWSYNGYNFPSAINDAEISPMLQQLEHRGWDVDVLNMLHLDRAYIWDEPEMIANLINRLIKRARDLGYRKVILYGGSRGGAEIIKAVIAGAEPDAVALMEPDWHGPKYDSRGGFNEDSETRSEEIFDLLEKMTTSRIVFAYFNNSRWYGDIQSRDVEKSLDNTGANYLLIANPPGLSGHGGSWTNRYANAYISCLDNFFSGDIDSVAECKPEMIDESKFENWVLKSHVTESGFQRLNRNEIRKVFSSKALCSYDPGEDSISKSYCQLWNDNKRITSFNNEFDQLITTTDLIDYTDTGYCRHNGMYSPTYRCEEIYKVDQDLFATIPTDRDTFSWFRLVDRLEVQKSHQQADFHCENESKLKSVLCRKL